MKKTNTWMDVTEGTINFGIEANKYFINQDGQIRTASKKAKKTIVDTRGREMVVVNCNGASNDTAIYVSDLLTSCFGTPDADNFNEKAIEEAKRAGSGPRRPKCRIVRVDNNQEYKSVAAAAKAFGFNYDKFYNAFYTKGVTTIVFEGITFKKITEGGDAAEEEAAATAE